MWGAEFPKGGEPLPNESPFIEGSLPVHGEGSATTEPPGADEPEAATPSGDHEVEVGEAPEEIPETEEEKRPRRRRGRRRRRSEGGPREDAPEEREMPDESAADADQGEEDAGEEDDEEEVEIVPFADWNVPSWQELIGSLYRPER